jgi:hypothetical protein
MSLLFVFVKESMKKGDLTNGKKNNNGGEKKTLEGKIKYMLLCYCVLAFATLHVPSTCSTYPSQKKKEQLNQKKNTPFDKKPQIKAEVII